MVKTSFCTIIVLIILLIPYVIYYEKICMNLFLRIMISRGISAPTCFWKSDSFNQLSYQKLLSHYGDSPILHFSNVKYIIPTDIGYIKQILELTPSIFKQHHYKYDFFKKLIGYDVDTVTGCPWKSQRVLNEKVLIMNYLQRYADYYNKTIQMLLEDNIPHNYKEFRRLSKEIIMKIIFQKDKIPNKICNFLLQPNKIFSSQNTKIELINQIRVFILNELHFSRPLSLLSLCKDTHLTKDELIEKIPPWIFPIACLIHTNVPKVLTYIIHNNKLNVLCKELRYVDLTDANVLFHMTYLKQCILETLRLQCPTTSSIRILSKPFTYNKDKTFYKHSQFVILNRNVLHHEQCFENPQHFIPERWTEEKEAVYSSLLFNHGTYHCPWKHIAIFIMSSFIAHYLKKMNILNGSNTLIIQHRYEDIQKLRKYGFSLRTMRK